MDTKAIIPKLAKNLQSVKRHIWRNDPTSFVTTLPGQELAPGIDTFAIGWYQQGHAVSFITILN